MVLCNLVTGECTGYPVYGLEEVIPNLPEGRYSLRFVDATGTGHETLLVVGKNNGALLSTGTESLTPDLMVYPNPGTAYNEVVLRLTDAREFRYKMTVTDVTGRQLQCKEVDFNPADPSITYTFEVPGFYQVHFEGEKTRFSKKIVIK